KGVVKRSLRVSRSIVSGSSGITVGLSAYPKTSLAAPPSSSQNRASASSAFRGWRTPSPGRDLSLAFCSRIAASFMRSPLSLHLCRPVVSLSAPVWGLGSSPRTGGGGGVPRGPHRARAAGPPAPGQGCLWNAWPETGRRYRAGRGMRASPGAPATHRAGGEPDAVASPNLPHERREHPPERLLGRQLGGRRCGAIP